MNAVEALRALRDALPVLPGGAYSAAVGVTSPGDNVAGPALSFALLRGDDEAWLKLQTRRRRPPGPQYPRPRAAVLSPLLQFDRSSAEADRD